MKRSTCALGRGHRALPFSPVCFRFQRLLPVVLPGLLLGALLRPSPSAAQASQTAPSSVAPRPATPTPPAQHLDLHLRQLVDDLRGGPLAFPAAAPKKSARLALYARCDEATSLPPAATANPTDAGTPPGANTSTLAACPRLTAQVTRLGGSSSALPGHILAIRLPFEALPAFAAAPSLRWAEAALPHQLMLDKSVPLIGAGRVQRGSGLAAPLTGGGVIVGLVDTGLDFRHPAFLDAAGHSRVLGLWDQTQEGTPPPGMSVGNYCDAASIESGACPAAIDVIGHGTHVAATAAGRDRSYGGVAPEANYLVAKSLSFTLLAESAQWIFEQADALGRPAVINMSLGGHYGAHDGSSLEEQALDALLGPGHLLVVAAGNEGSERIHLGAELGATEQRSELLVAPGFGSNGGFFDLWVAKEGSLKLALELRDKDDQLLATTGFVDSATPFSSALTDAQGSRVADVQLSVAGPQPENQRLRANLYLVPASNPDTSAGNAAGTHFALVMTGAGHLDGWVASSSLFGGGAVFGTRADSGYVAGDAVSSVAMPGTAAGAITVAAYSSRKQWTALDGSHFEDPSVVLGDRAAFSSMGPSADPSRTGLKPEISAPGEYIAAPFGSNVVVFDKRMLLEEDVVAMRGTSMATPHVTGTLALLLEADPTLDPARARDLLERTATTDAFTGRVPNPAWGYGKLNAYAAALELLGTGDAGGGGGASKGCGCTAAPSGRTSAAPGTAQSPAWGLLLSLLSLPLLRRHSRRPQAEASQ